MQYFIGNWKMNLNSPLEIKNMTDKFMEGNKNQKDYVGFACQTHQLSFLKDCLQGSNIKVGAQNFFPKESGAYTGEVSLESLKEFGAHFVLVGHSERRQYFGETNQSCLEKINYALNSQTKTVYCFGESLETFEEGKTAEFLKEQLSILKNVDPSQSENLILAYEPIWAIGTGKTATKEIINSTSITIREHLNETNPHLSSTPLLYGGSVKPQNIQEIMSVAEINGVLVGGASLEADSFSQITGGN